MPLDPQLLELCSPSVALRTVLLSCWFYAGNPTDVAASVPGFMRAKLVHELLVNEGGTLRKGWSFLESSATLTQLGEG